MSVKIVDNGLNPRIVIDHDEIESWLRSIADRVGYWDRQQCEVQLNFEDSITGEIYGKWKLPKEIVFTVSDIPNSRCKMREPRD